MAELVRVLEEHLHLGENGKNSLPLSLLDFVRFNNFFCQSASKFDTKSRMEILGSNSHAPF